MDEDPDPVPDDPDEPDPGVFGTITFDPNGGILFMEDEWVDLPVPEGYTLPIPTRMGYTFMGWYLGDTLITDESLSQITASCTLVAHWEEDEGGGEIVIPPVIGPVGTYTIVYHSGGGSGIGPMAQTVSVIGTVTIAENTFERLNYVFTGWSLSSTGAPEYQPGQRVSGLGEAGETVDLYACWAPLGGGEVMTVPPSDEGGGCPSGQTEGETTTSYTTTYTYDANNRLVSEVSNKTGENVLVSYTYDDNGNLLSQLDVNSTAIVTHEYDGFNQLVSSVTGEGTITYTYNAQGIRTSRTAGLVTTHYLLDGGNVIGEVTGDETVTYVRGVNLIFGRARYYLYNAHGDVVQLTNTNGELTRNYNYDAFGNERAPKEDDLNPFRYCGEYYDTETGLYYLRARYYDPLVGRFTQEDSHWNTANMIYGDNPQKINEREDKLGLKHYSYAPELLSILQAGNLYLYCVSNPVDYCDYNGCNTLAKEVAFGINTTNPDLFRRGAFGGGATVVLIEAISDALSKPEIYEAKGKSKNSGSKSGEVSISGGSSPASPDPDKDPNRKWNISKSESKVWKKLDNVKNSKLKSSGNGANKRFYEWDYTHNDIEVYNSRGEHLGSIDPITGDFYKPPVVGRTIKVP